MARSKASLVLESNILDALKKSSKSTRALADALGEDKGKIYRHCRRLENDGSLNSILMPGTRLLYCVDDARVVAGADYENCKEQDHDLRSFYNEERVWSLVASSKVP